MRTNRRKILVVDHDTNFRTACVSALLPLGCHILEAQDGQQGYERFVQEGADLVISADHLPGLTGIEMVRKIRQTDKEVMVLLLKRDRSDDLEGEAINLGSCRVLTKPLYPRQFRSLVEAALPLSSPAETA